MVREHGSLTKDAETNQAAWEAVKGGAYGGIKVCEVARAFILQLPTLGNCSLSSLLPQIRLWMLIPQITYAPHACCHYVIDF